MIGLSLKFDSTINHSTTLILNYRKFCDSWNISQFLFQSIIDMLCHSFNISGEQICHLLAIQPYRFVLYTHLQSDSLIRLVHHNLTLVVLSFNVVHNLKFKRFY